MSHRLNEFGQPIGPDVPGWTPRPWPARITLTGQYCRLEPFNAALHSAKLYQTFTVVGDSRDWTYKSQKYLNSEPEFMDYARKLEECKDSLHFAVIDKKTNQPVGTMALKNIVPEHGTMEVGFIAFSRLLQRTRASTESHYLLMQYVFETLGYRRYEWQNDRLNVASHRAASRLGFHYEGTFRQAKVLKGRSRDTEWFSMLDIEWPHNKAALQAWLAADNFDAEGTQRRSLEQCRSEQ